MTPPKNVTPFVVAQAGTLHGAPTISAGAGVRAEKNNWYAQGEAKIGNELAVELTGGTKIPLGQIKDGPSSKLDLGLKGSYRNIFGHNSTGKMDINGNVKNLCDVPETRIAFTPSYEMGYKNWKASLGLELGYKNNEPGIQNKITFGNLPGSPISIRNEYGGAYATPRAGFQYTTNNGKMTFGTNVDKYGGEVTAKINL